MKLKIVNLSNLDDYVELGSADLSKTFDLKIGRLVEGEINVDFCGGKIAIVGYKKIDDNYTIFLRMPMNIKFGFIIEFKDNIILDNIISDLKINEV